MLKLHEFEIMPTITTGMMLLHYGYCDEELVFKSGTETYATLDELVTAAEQHVCKGYKED